MWFLPFHFSKNEKKKNDFFPFAVAFPKICRFLPIKNIYALSLLVAKIYVLSLPLI